ncbi:MAG TPA: hypothetical protein VHB25_06950 [Gemmatimonadaceae bacterium]|nr:hypothetical protein [Gemmatimonadaceae bacterium]
MIARRIRHVALSLSLTAAAVAVPASAALASRPPVRAARLARVAVDPVGDYQWSLTMAAMQNTQIAGTLSITRKDSALAATLTSDHTDGELAASSVTQEGDTVTVVTNGDFGQFTLLIDFSQQEPAASFKFVGQDGTADQGPVSLKRVDKK